MNVLYVGKFFPEQLLKNVVENNKGQMVFANHNFEMSIINGLCMRHGGELRCISIPNVYSYPYHNTKIYTQAESYNYKSAKIYSVGFCNLPLIKEIWATLSFLYRIVICLNKFSGDVINVIVNTPSNKLLIGIKVASYFTRKKLSTTVIIPDVPAQISIMDDCNRIKKKLLQYSDNLAISLASKANGLVLLTEAMLDYFHRPVRYIVMEGVIDVNKIPQGIDIDSPKHIENDRKAILYTGTLRRIFGIMNLIDAFRQVNDVSVDLYLCGAGDALEDILEASKTDARIKYLGVVDSRTALQFQREATILVNPRTSDGEFTKYSFPSKTIEYMLSGKPVIMNALPGIPSEYYKYLFIPKDESVEALRDCISEVLAMSTVEIQKRTQSARDFIIKNKNADVQVKRILDFIQTYR